MIAHVTPPRTYYMVFALLIVLTVVTIGISFMPLAGAWHLALGLVIGLAKALLVVLFFMHVLQSTRLTWLVLAAGLLWLGIMLAYTLQDYLTRYPGGPFPFPGH